MKQKNTSVGNIGKTKIYIYKYEKVVPEGRKNAKPKTQYHKNNKQNYTNKYV